MSESVEIDVNEAAAAAKRLASSTNTKTNASQLSAAAWTPYLFYSQVPPPAPFYQNTQIGGANGVNFTNFSSPPISQRPATTPSQFNYAQQQVTYPSLQQQNSWNINHAAVMNNNSNNNSNEVIDRIPRNPSLAFGENQGPKPIRFSLQQPGKRHAYNKPSFNSSVGAFGKNNSNGGTNSNPANSAGMGVNLNAQTGRVNKNSRFSPAIGSIDSFPESNSYTSTTTNNVGNKQSEQQSVCDSTNYGLASGSTWANSTSPIKGNSKSPAKQDISECIKVENWSPSLKKYAERWYEVVFATGADNVDKAQELLQDKLEAAFKAGNFQTKDWTYEPLPILPTTGALGYKTGLIPGTVKGSPLRPDVGSNGILRGRGRGGTGSIRGRGGLSGAETFKSSRGRAKGIRGRNRFTSRSSSRSRSRSLSESSDSSGSYSKGSKRKRSSSKGKNGKSSTSPVLKKKAKKEKGKKNKKKGAKGHMYSEFGNVGGGIGAEAEARRNARAERFAKENSKSSNKTIKSRLGAYAASKEALFDWVLDTNPSFVYEMAEASMSRTVVGTCTDLEKKYLRLTSMPEASTIRPVPILKKSLAMVCRKWKENENYEYACEQLKSIRQDLTVQRIRDPFTVLVYETHARIGLEKGDHEEFNQCQSQLVQLYKSVPGAGEHRLEFTAYRILYCIFTANTLDLGNILASLSDDDKKDKCIVHALQLRTAWAMGNYSKFFKLHRVAPNMSGFLIDWFANRERKRALKSILKAYRPTVPLSYVLNQLDLTENGWKEFLKTTQLEAAIIFDVKDKKLIDAKNSHSALTAIQPSA